MTKDKLMLNQSGTPFLFEPFKDGTREVVHRIAHVPSGGGMSYSSNLSVLSSHQISKHLCIIETGRSYGEIDHYETTDLSVDEVPQ